MNFTKQDFYTFVVGLGAAVVVELATRFENTDAILANPEAWLHGLVIGLLSAAGRYLLTFLTQKRFVKAQAETRAGKPVTLTDVTADTVTPTPEKPVRAGTPRTRKKP